MKNSRYNQVSVADEEIADVLLSEKNAAPLAATLIEPELNKEEEPIYELEVNEPPAPENLNQQVDKLYHEYAAINQRLEKSLVASNELAKQLEKSKKVATASYVALGVAGLAFLVGVGAIVVGINMQRDVLDLRNSVTSLTDQAAVARKERSLKNKATDDQLAQLNDKVDKVFAVNNLDNVLQVTRELKKQVQMLASKNLALMGNSGNHSVNQSAKADKIALPSLKLAPEELQHDKALATAQSVDKSEAATKLDATQKAQENKPADTDNSAHLDAGSNWVITFGSYKDKKIAKSTAAKFKKAGLSVDIIPSKTKKQVWYRVISKPFKNKQQAQNHAEHIEKTLGIHSAVLSKIK